MSALANFSYSNPLHVEVARGLVRYAVGRHLFCSCGSALDATRAVQFRYLGRENVACGHCFDSLPPSQVSEVFDGRLLWPAREPEPKREPMRNVAHLGDVHVGDRVELRVGGHFVPVKVVGTFHRNSYGTRRQCRTFFYGVNERTNREVRFTAAKVRRFLPRDAA